VVVAVDGVEAAPSQSGAAPKSIGRRDVSSAKPIFAIAPGKQNYRKNWPDPVGRSA
jgi:hypothetical protein